MRLRCRVIVGVLVGLCTVLLIVHWELSASDDSSQPHWFGGRGDSKWSQSDDSNTAQVSHTGSFQNLTKGTYIYSAFIDVAAQEIRLIVLSGKHHQPRITCHFCLDKQTCSCPSQTVTYYTNNENHGRQYGGFIASCKLPSCFYSRYFIYLSVEDKKKRLRVPLVSTALSRKRYQYSICTPPLRGQGPEFLYQIAEFIELSLMLGANHITFYDYQIDDAVKQLLLYYKQLGVVSIQTWNLPGHVTSNVNQLWYHGQVLAIQDCLFRGKAVSKFIAFNDIDEFIVPPKHRTVPSLLRKIHTSEHCGHCFDCVIFSLNARFPGARKSRLRSVRVDRRTRETLPSWSKCIVDPPRVFEMGIHHVSKATNPKLTLNKVNPKKGLLFHYRTCSSAFGIGKVCGDLVTDTTMQRFTRKLQEKVNTAIRHSTTRAQL